MTSPELKQILHEIRQGRGGAPAKWTVSGLVAAAALMVSLIAWVAGLASSYGALEARVDAVTVELNRRAPYVEQFIAIQSSYRRIPKDIDELKAALRRLERKVDRLSRQRDGRENSRPP